MHIVTVDQMRELEARAEREYGLTSAILMENAGRSAAEILARHMPQQRAVGQKIVILVGPGNNGGDGLVMARYLKQWGAHICLYRWKEQELTFDGEEFKLPQSAISPDPLPQLQAIIRKADYVLDALLGTGRSRPLPDSMRALLSMVQEERKRRGEESALKVVAIDLPTGMNADTGEVDSGTIPADMTITLACPKQGFFFFPGRDYTGELQIG